MLTKSIKNTCPLTKIMRLQLPPAPQEPLRNPIMKTAPPCPCVVVQKENMVQAPCRGKAEVSALL